MQVNDLYNYGYHALHLAVIFLNIFGWVSKPTWVAQSAVLFFTLVSWLGFGFTHGFGYCFLTDWHWDVKRDLGHQNLPHSYTKWLYDFVFDADIAHQTIDVLTIAGLVFGLLAWSVRTFIEVRRWGGSRETKTE